MATRPDSHRRDVRGMDAVELDSVRADGARRSTPHRVTARHVSGANAGSTRAIVIGSSRHRSSRASSSTIRVSCRHGAVPSRSAQAGRGVREAGRQARRQRAAADHRDDPRALGGWPVRARRDRSLDRARGSARRDAGRAAGGAGEDERWFDIDLDEQVLVAYEATRPVYATLVSSGRPLHWTPRSSRASVRTRERPHDQQQAGERYSVADVPWTMYYDGNYALHTSYCTTASARSAATAASTSRRATRACSTTGRHPTSRRAGAASAATRQSGSLVRVHSRRVTEPPVVGYARTMLAQQ